MRIFFLIQSIFSDNKLLTLDNSTPQTDPSCANFEKHNIVTSEQILSCCSSTNMRELTPPTRYIVNHFNNHILIAFFNVTGQNTDLGKSPCKMDVSPTSFVAEMPLLSLLCRYRPLKSLFSM